MEALGPMTLREKMLSCLFVLALGGWVFSQSLGVNESTVAIGVMALMLVLRIVTDDVIKNKGMEYAHMVRRYYWFKFPALQSWLFLWLADLLKIIFHLTVMVMSLSSLLLP